MRGTIEGLMSPHPLGNALPSILQRDEFAMTFVSVFDDCLAPVFWTLDSSHAYFDPSVAPDDFVVWLGSWVGLTMDESWPIERRREHLAKAAELYRFRGTPMGLAKQVELLTGTAPDVVDSGGVSWSSEPEAALPGNPLPRVVVRVTQAAVDAAGMAHINALVEAGKPAHVAHAIEVITG
jgi:phage tail-like protein